MHDFDYDAMEKKRIARGAMHMKRGSKSKKCGLPHDGLTAAQLRRLNGPVSTYKMDEPMDWARFKAMPDDLQKQYIKGLQDTYQATDDMLGKMFGVSKVTVVKYRNDLGVESLGRIKGPRKELEIRLAKWDAFCNGVVGGKPGEAAECAMEEISNQVTEDTDVEESIAPTTEELIRPSRFDVTFNTDIWDYNDVAKLLKHQCLPAGKCRIRISIEQC